MAIKVSLTVIDGPDKGFTYDFVESTVTVGRRDGEIVLNDKKVSSAHCKFTIEGDQLFVEDCHSTNGTFISGRRIETKEEISNLDQVVVGLTRISVAIIDHLERKQTPTHSQSKKTAARPPLESFLEEPSSSVGMEDSDILSDVEFRKAKGAPAPQAATPVKPASPAVSTPPAVKSSESVQTHALPPPEAEYRTTGIRRIEDLISDEMHTMSKWDDPELKEKGDPLSIPRIRVNIKVKKGPDGPLEFFCTQAVTTLGRKEVDIRLNDLDCSRKHAQIEIVNSKKVFVKDLASTNGTYVNGKKITEQEIFSGDLVQIGQTLFEVNIQSGS